MFTYGAYTACLQDRRVEEVLDLPVPTHPGRTLFDLVLHVGMGRRDRRDRARNP